MVLGEIVTELLWMIEAIERARASGRYVYLCGNGGSAALADHLAVDLLKKGVRAFSLCANGAVVTAFANDESYENVFIEQLKVLLDPRDVVIGISTSGRSENVNRALIYAETVCEAVFAFPNGTDVQAMENEHVALAHKLIRELA